MNMRRELVLLSDETDWNWIEEDLSGLFSDTGRSGTTMLIILGLLLPAHIHALSVEGVCERWRAWPGAYESIATPNS